MAKAVGIEFKKAGKIYWFNPDPFKLYKDDKVVVETVRGMELGTVVIEPREQEERETGHELKTIVRIANKNDLKTYRYNTEKAKKDLITCGEIISRNKLDMKLLSCEYTLDRQKIIIYYNADGRVDFRELLKELASEFKTRIELRQVGSREGAKFIGGVGLCGRELCCRTHLREFGLVTMKMAKDQNMSLSASKIAGLCGKLMCCIAYENGLYEEIRKRIPLSGDIVDTPASVNCRVVGVDILREKLKVCDGEGNITEWDADETTRVRSHKEEITAADLTDEVKDE